MLKDKVCLITGCAQGIGHEMVRVFAENGATVYANDLREGDLSQYCEEISERYGTSTTALFFDITDKAAAKEAFRRIKEERGGIDVLVNNAARPANALFEMVTRQNLEEMFQLNVIAQIEMMQQAVRQMKRRKGGSIVNFSSCVGIDGNPGQLAYAATKGAMNAITKTTAKELAKYGIRVNAVAPGLTKTSMYDGVSEEEMRDRVSRITLGRLAQPVEIANLVAFLASDKASYITGQIIKADGLMLM